MEPGIVTPDCPECGQPGDIFSPTQALCRNADSCRILIWDPTRTAAELYADGGPDVTDMAGFLAGERLHLTGFMADTRPLGQTRRNGRPGWPGAPSPDPAWLPGEALHLPPDCP